MTLRSFIDVAYAIAIEEFREVGLHLSDAIAKVDEIIRPVIPVEVDPMAERIVRAKQNVAAYLQLGAITGTRIGRRKAKARPA